MTEQIEAYAKHLNANSEVLNWIGTAGKKALIKNLINSSDMEHIVDYLVSPAAPVRLQKMSFVDAKRKSEEWSKSNQKRGRDIKESETDTELVHDFFDGTKIVLLKTKKAYEREGFLMSHCVGGYSLDKNVLIYSYRDAKNMPHATFELRKQNSEILQIKGKGNGSIHPKYIHPILAFLKTVGVNIRTSEMKNLGYYHIPAEHLEFLRKFKSASIQLVTINGKNYAV